MPNSQMYDYVFNEEEMKKKEKKQEKEDEKKRFHFFNCQVRTGCGF